MATATLRPNDEISRHADWAITDGGASEAWEVLDDAVTQPTAPGTGSDYIRNNQIGPTDVEVALTTQTIGTVTEAKVWYYAALSGTTPSLTTKLFKGATEIATATITSGAAAWRSVTYTGGLTQAEVDDLRIRFTGSNVLSDEIVYAAYVELTYSPIAFVRDGGTVANKAPTTAANTVTVPAAGHAVGNLVVMYAGSMGSTPLTDPASDSRGNTWVTLHRFTSVGAHAVICASVLTTALQSGDTITYTNNATPDEVVIVTKEFSGVTTTEDVASAGNGHGTGSTTPTAGAITPPSAETLVLSEITVEGPSDDGFTDDTDTNGGAGWTTLRVGTTGGGAASNLTGIAAHKITTSSVAQEYNPTLGSARVWGAAVVALQAGAAPLPQLLMPPKIAT